MYLFCKIFDLRNLSHSRKKKGYNQEVCCKQQPYMGEFEELTFMDTNAQTAVNVHNTIKCCHGHSARYHFSHKYNINELFHNHIVNAMFRCQLFQ